MENSDMWQVYLYLANERQVSERSEAAQLRAPGESRIRRWRKARRTVRVERAATRTR